MKNITQNVFEKSLKYFRDIEQYVKSLINTIKKYRVLFRSGIKKRWSKNCTYVDDVRYPIPGHSGDWFFSSDSNFRIPFLDAGIGDVCRSRKDVWHLPRMGEIGLHRRTLHAIRRRWRLVVLGGGQGSSVSWRLSTIFIFELYRVPAHTYTTVIFYPLLYERRNFI